MEYRCGNCGVLLEDAALDSGICPSCSAHISPFGDVIEPMPQQRTDQGTLPLPPDEPIFISTDPAPFTDDRLLATQARLASIRISRATGRLAEPIGAASFRTPTAGLLLGIGIAVVMVLLCTLAATSMLLSGFASTTVPVSTKVVLHVTQPPTTPITGIGFPTQNPDPTPLPYLQETPTFAPTTTPFGGPPTPTPTPSPSVTVTITPGGSGSVLQVSPTNMQIHCPSDKVKFTVGNVGTGLLAWNASGGSFSTITPGSGLLPPGGSVDVRVQNVVQSGTIIFTDLSGNSPPVTVQITC